MEWDVDEIDGLQEKELGEEGVVGEHVNQAELECPSDSEIVKSANQNLCCVRKMVVGGR